MAESVLSNAYCVLAQNPFFSCDVLQHTGLVFEYRTFADNALQDLTKQNISDGQSVEWTT